MVRIPDKEIRRLVNTINSIFIDKETLLNLVKFELKIEDNEFEKKAAVQLATGSFEYSEDLFKKKFLDYEDELSIHRFNWLLLILYQLPNKNTIRLGIDSINSWVNDDIVLKRSNGYDAYSISERLVNWLFFFCFIKETTFFEEISWDLIALSFSKQIKFLSSNLEYYGSYTNNHALNNGRALYIFGRLLRLVEIELLGKKIIEERIKLILKGGYIQEDSIHYQFLITKWFLDIYMVSLISKDSDFSNYINELINYMLEITNQSFSDYNCSYPCIGDISPDLDTNYFKGFPFKNDLNQKSAWYSLFGRTVKYNFNYENLKKIDFSEINYWRKIKLYKWEIWVVVKNNGILSHGHSDNGSCVIYYKGIPLIVDPGMFTYDKTDLIRRSQYSVGGHFVPDIKKVLFEVKVPIKNHKSSIRSRMYITDIEGGIEYKMRSLDLSVLFKRVIRNVDADELIIYDSLEEGNDLENSFSLNLDCFDKDVKIEKKCVFVKIGKFEFCIEFGEKCKLTKKSFFDSEKYGAKISKVMLQIESRLFKNIETITRIKRLK